MRIAMHCTFSSKNAVQVWRGSQLSSPDTMTPLLILQIKNKREFKYSVLITGNIVDFRQPQTRECSSIIVTRKAHDKKVCIVWWQISMLDYL